VTASRRSTSSRRQLRYTEVDPTMRAMDGMATSSSVTIQLGIPEIHSKTTAAVRAGSYCDG
jgi:hypothetical protein